MIITNFQPAMNQYTVLSRQSVQYAKQNTLNTDTLSFKGHTQNESYIRNGIGRLVHETALFRGKETLDFVANYVKKNCAGKNKINIISGGCSTGEEAVTLSMMLDNQGKRLILSV